MPLDSQCRTCVYWRQLYRSGHAGSNGFSSTRACHYLLDNGTSRKHTGDVCYSYEEIASASNSPSHSKAELKKD